ncbi:MAG: phosphoribosylformylglycinamidine synthase subunit PurS [Elusimicrobia bacterium]|nr:phosphoribosylformylglycinamidine synthase subunit PurS [Elusimicrobiota bacterium]
MNWRVLVHMKPAFVDHRGEGIKKEWRMARLKGVHHVRVGQAYEISGEIDEANARRLADRLLVDPVTQEAGVFPADHVARPKGGRLAEIWLKKGVSDPVADTVRLAAADLGVQGLAGVRSGQVFDFMGDPTPKAIRQFCEEHLMNALVQSVEVL